jgi:hypothetical protein
MYVFKKILFLSVVLVMIIGCLPDGDPPVYHRDLNVPYRAWEVYDYCTVACIQMWGLYDGLSYQQDVIANYIGAPTTPNDAETGVGMFTRCIGFLEVEPAYGGFQQDLCIAYSIACVDNEREPSIMPFYGGAHAILAKGFDWHRNQYLTPIADFMRYHDPNPAQGGYLEMTGTQLKQRFSPANGYYFVITGMRFAWQWGLTGLLAFLDEGGTYYGGPLNYDPSGM